MRQPSMEDNVCVCVTRDTRQCVIIEGPSSVLVNHTRAGNAAVTVTLTGWYNIINHGTSPTALSQISTPTMHTRNID